MPNNNYPLHPGQTHATPYYVTIPMEEYERLISENKRLNDALKRNGLNLVNEVAHDL